MKEVRKYDLMRIFRILNFSRRISLSDDPTFLYLDVSVLHRSPKADWLGRGGAAPENRVLKRVPGFLFLPFWCALNITFGWLT